MHTTFLGFFQLPVILIFKHFVVRKSRYRCREGHVSGFWFYTLKAALLVSLVRGLCWGFCSLSVRSVWTFSSLWLSRSYPLVLSAVQFLVWFCTNDHKAEIENILGWLKQSVLSYRFYFYEKCLKGRSVAIS